jgi:starch phosphorylase
MFRTIDADAWKEAHSNPIQLLNILSYEKLVALGNDKDFVKKLNGIYDRFKEYINTPLRADRPSVAYFSMEYGLTEVLKIYSGGLGVLAGDYLKEASDCAINMTAVGLLYRYGYFTQALSIDGQQVPVYEAQNFNALPIKQVMDEKRQSGGGRSSLSRTLCICLSLESFGRSYLALSARYRQRNEQ